MRHTIQHAGTRVAIERYLEVSERVLTGSRIADYMLLMHGVMRHTTYSTLSRLLASGRIERVRRGRYRSVM